MEFLADDFVKVYESPDPSGIYTYSPGIALLPGGRLVATMDLSGPAIGMLDGPTEIMEGGKLWFGKVFTSDDRGQTWTHRTDFPFMHARPFTAGSSVYVIGQCNDLMIMRSDDNGETWREPVRLTDGQIWHQAPSNVHYAKGSVYLVMERKVYDDIKGWWVSILAPVLMRGRADADLTQRDNWTFASELAFRDAVPSQALEWFGVPFFSHPFNEPSFPAPKRANAPIGWLETNVVQFTDPAHYWYDPEGRTFHLWMRAHTGGTGLAAIAKVVEQEDGSMETMLVTAPSGRKMVYVPCPGGQMKFHIVYDEQTKLYWLLSSQATDSMTRAELLPDERCSLPNNERHRLQLHFSKNCIDWCFAGMVSAGASPRQSRHYASLQIDGDDLYVLSRSGDEKAHNPHDVNFISFHKIRDFRSLVY
jgi:hypothetical protein